MEDKTGVHYHPRYFRGVPLPELPDRPPLPISFDTFLGDDYQIAKRGGVGPRRMFGNAGLAPGGPRFDFGDYTIGAGLYSRNEATHRRVNKQYSVAWLASRDGKVVAGRRLGWVWVHPHHRRRGLATELGAVAWQVAPLAVLYVRFGWRQWFTIPGLEREKRLYEVLIERGILTRPD
jgi:hypothetical protein